MTTSGAARTGFMEHIWHKLIGTRGASSIFPDSLSYLNESVSTTSNFGEISMHPSKEIAKHKLVFLGEIHSMPPIISFQREIQAEMNKQSDNLHVILEHFSFDLQELLDRYMDNEIDFDQLVDKYHETGEEGHDIEPYRYLLEDAKKSRNTSTCRIFATKVRTNVNEGWRGKSVESCQRMVARGCQLR